MSFRIIIFTRRGSQICDFSRGTMPNDDEANFRGILSILEPISQTESEYLFTMKLGPFHVDVFFALERYVFSIVPASTKSTILNFNPIFAWAASQCFTSLMSEQSEEVSQQMIDTFVSMLPMDPLNEVSKVMKGLLIAGVNYVSFIAQGHRVFLHLGETKMPPDEFIFAWCAALEATEQLDEVSWAPVPEHDSVAVTTFVPSMKIVVFFTDKATKIRTEYFISEITKIKQKLMDIFSVKEMRVHMPQMPKHGPTARRGRP